MEERNLNFEEFIKAFYEKYIVDDGNAAVIKKISLWASRDSSFEDKKLGHHLDKGLLIMGDVGTGKTDLFRLLRIYLKDYKKSNYAYDCSVVWELTAEFNENGYPSLKPHEVKNMYYDELCLTNERTNFPEKERAIHFGQKLVIGEELILTRYNSFKKSGYQTHFSTNASLDELLEVYGTRPYSRLQEMCNFLILTGEDKRSTSNPNLYNNINVYVKPKPKEVSEEEVLENKKMLDSQYDNFIKTNDIGDLAAIHYDLLKIYGCDLGGENGLEEFKKEAQKIYFQPLVVTYKTPTEKQSHKATTILIEAKRIAVRKFYQNLKAAGAKSIFGLIYVDIPILPSSESKKVGEIATSDVSEIKKLES